MIGREGRRERDRERASLKINDQGRERDKQTSKPDTMVGYFLEYPWVGFVFWVQVPISRFFWAFGKT